MTNNRCFLRAVILLIIAGVLSAEPPALKLATTTSTENTGLLGVLLPAFTKTTGITVNVIAVGTGKAIKLGENGDVDVILVHDPDAEKKFVDSGFGVDRRKVMYNDFVIIGPSEDPAGIRGLKSASVALKKISEKAVPFVSRGDESGTHIKEKLLWKAAGVIPAGPWYLSAGQGMGAVLMIANEKLGYTLTDRATYMAFVKKITLPILVEGDSLMNNPYCIIAVNPKRYPGINYSGAMKLIGWITSKEGQQTIRNFTIDNKQVFFLYPPGPR